LGIVLTTGKYSWENNYFATPSINGLYASILLIKYVRVK
jgi:hypothetical protein